ncbi:MAG: fumarylacetoacetate hydrolase family protein [Cryobacterium sp.]|nr:fumarylacetoacetate hydrolase family protein [Cryobacterium sp.]
MQLATVRSDTLPAGSTRAAVNSADGWVVLDAPDLSALLSDTPGMKTWQEAVESALASSSQKVASEDLEFLNPLPNPRKVICCGLNYRDHILETGRELPKFPTLFAKFAETLTDPNAEITVIGSEKVDWEAELAIVAGAKLQRAGKEEAAKGILGYTIANDVSMRDWQHRTLQWLQGKAFDRTTPVGPVVVTADELDPKSGLEVTCSINGNQTQSGNTRELVFDAAALLSYVSQFTTLHPGDLILSGTPGGIGGAMNPPVFLNDGDEVVTAIEGIGELRNVFRIQSD